MMQAITDGLDSGGGEGAPWRTKVSSFDMDFSTS